MATSAGQIGLPASQADMLSGTPRAHAVDRWIFVFMAAWFIAIVLTGFIPDSLAKIAAVQSGARPPFPLVLHIHAVLMGSFLLLLLAQTTLAATGKLHLHRQLGLVGMVLVPALVIAGFILAYTMYHSLWAAAQSAQAESRGKLQAAVLNRDNITLFQARIGILFSLFLFWALKARDKDAGFHKRMMILATAVTLPAGIDRIMWLPTTLPGSPLATDVYTLLAVAPMFLWDVMRSGGVHRAYWLWGSLYIPLSAIVHVLWDTELWHGFVPRLMGV